jgi:Flp pilus assembly protein TadD
MPTRVYMGIDARHDHSFRIPRPDRTLSLGVPNACDKCHAERGVEWARAAIAQHKPNGSQGFQGFAETFAALERGDASAAGAALALVADGSVPAIVRASALDRLRRVNEPPDGAVLVAASRDLSPLVRRAAAAVAGSAPDAGLRLTVLVPLLTDPTRAVRIEAAGGLDEVPDNQIPEAAREAFRSALEEYHAAQRFNADRPEALVNLATSLSARGDAAGARAAFREAMTIDRTFTPAWVNLAELERATGNEAEAERLLREAMGMAPQSGVAPHALGLSLIRQRKLGEALAALKEASRREPENARFAFVYAVALHDAGRGDAALAVLKDVHLRHPADRDVLGALAALESAAARHPGDAAIRDALAAYRQER